MKACKSKVLFNTWEIQWNRKKDLQHIKGGLLFASLHATQAYIKAIREGQKHIDIYTIKA